MTSRWRLAMPFFWCCLAVGGAAAAPTAHRNDFDILDGFVYGMGAGWSFAYAEEAFDDRQRTYYRRILHRIVKQGRRDVSAVQASVVAPPGVTNPSGAPLAIVGASADNASVAVVGYVDTGPGTPNHAFRYSEADGFRALGTLGSADELSFAADSSLDGNAITGASTINQLATYKAFLWTPGGGMVDLDPLSGTYAIGLAISDDGNTIVGQRDTPQGRRGFVWTMGGGFAALTGIEPGSRTLAVGLTPDGSTVVGESTLNLPVGNTSVRRTHAVRWRKGDNFTAQDLGSLTGYAYSTATGMNNDGSVVVGIASQFEVSRAGPGAVARPAIGGNVAFRWTEATGMVDLRDLLVDAGLDMSGIEIHGATAVSPDGSLIAVVATVPGLEPGQSVALMFCYADETLPDIDCTSPDGFARPTVPSPSKALPWLFPLLEDDN